MQILHGIRRSFLRPVWAPLQRCLPLLALLNCCHEDGNLLPLTNLNQPFGEADQEVDADQRVEEDGDLLPNSGVDDEGDLLPSGEEEEGGDLLPTSGEANHGGDLLPTSGEEDDDGILLPRSGDEATKRNVLPLQHDGQGEEEGSNLADSVSMNLLPPMKPASNAGQSQEVSALPLMKGEDGVVESHPHHLPPWVMLIPRPRVKMKGGMLYNNVHAWEHDAWTRPSTTPTSSMLLILLDVRLHKQQPYLTKPSITLRGSFHREEDAAAYFLIPLRGSNSMQWNDEVFDEDVGELKMKTKRRMMVLRFLYLMKDLLDPG